MKTFEKVISGSNEYGIPKCKFNIVHMCFHCLINSLRCGGKKTKLHVGVLTITHTITSVMFAWFFHVLKL
jgi:hypothetical protein